jgi:hypothetical protein
LTRTRLGYFSQDRHHHIPGKRDSTFLRRVEGGVAGWVGAASGAERGVAARARSGAVGGAGATGGGGAWPVERGVAREAGSKVGARPVKVE